MCRTRVVSDTETTPMITLNYIIFLNYYPCRHVGVCVCVRASYLRFTFLPSIIYTFP